MEKFDLNSIGSLLSGSGLSAISRRTKIKREDVAKVLTAGIPALVGGMNRNVSQRNGGDALTRALNDHSAANISDPAAFLKTSDLQDGKKILGHVLGEDQDALAEEISRATGVTKGKTLTILAIVAPLLLTLLGNQNNQSSGGGLLGLLGGLLGMGGGASSGGLLGGIFGGSQPEPQQQSSGGLLGNLLGGGSNLAGGLFSSLMGGNQGGQDQNNTIHIADNQPQQEESSSGGLLDSILGLLH